jgi:hypothetical protein
MVKEIVARLTLIVEFEEVPSEDELDEIVEAARSYGTTKKAEFETLKPVKRTL